MAKKKGLATQNVKLAVEKSMPQWVAKINNKEDMANAMMATGQEFLLVVEDVLIRYFEFDEKKIAKFHEQLKPILMGVKEFEKHGLSVMSVDAVGKVGDMVDEKGIVDLLAEMADIRFKKEKLDRAGMEYPTMIGATPYIRKLKEK